MSDRFLPVTHKIKAKLNDLTERYKGFVTLYQAMLHQQRRDGDEIVVEREIHDHGQAICVLPVDRARRVALLVRQLRVPLLFNNETDPMLLEVAAGLIDDGEDAIEAAKREAAEELGFTIHDLFHTGRFYASPGILTERIDGFLASYTLDDRISNGGGLKEEHEDIIIEEIALDELGDAVLEGRLRDAKTIILIQQLMLAEPELFF